MQLDLALESELAALAARVTVLESATGIVPGAQPSFGIYTSETEIDSLVPVTQGSLTQWRIVHKVTLPGLLANDILMMFTGAEVRNDAGYNTEFADELMLTVAPPGPTDEMGTGGGWIIGDISGTDISPVEHYFRPQRAEAFIMPVPVATPLLYYRVRCRSTAATGNEYCTIMSPGYGRMSVVVIRGGQRL